jgi:hypothetical protein
VAVLVLVALLVCACGEDSAGDGGGGEAGGAAGGGQGGGAELCAAGERSVGAGAGEPERCVAAGVQDDGCLAGEYGQEDGSCVPAGFPPELCPSSLSPQGRCELPMPFDTCTEGLIAVPGDDECREVMACGEGTWGEIPVEPDTQFVDAAYAGGSSDGTAAAPWLTIGEAVTAAAPGAIVAIAAGSYAEDVLVQDKAVRLWGRCPAMVEVVGVSEPAAISILWPAAEGSEVHGVATQGSGFGIRVADAEQVLVAGSWLHDTGEPGIILEHHADPIAVTVRDTLIERAGAVGVVAYGADLNLERVAIRYTQTTGAAPYLGYGVQAGTAPNGRPTSLHVDRSILYANHTLGMLVTGSSVTVQDSVIQDTAPSTPHGDEGGAIRAQLHSATHTVSELTVRRSLLHRNRMFAISVVASHARLEGVVVRGTLSRDLDLGLGVGVFAEGDPAAAMPASLELVGSAIEYNTDVGVWLFSASGAIVGSTITDGLSTGVHNSLGAGLFVQELTPGAPPEPLRIEASTFLRNQMGGVLLVGVAADVEGVVVEDTRPTEAGNVFGDGIQVVSEENPASADIRHSLIDGNARAGLALFGASAATTGSHYGCNAFDLSGDPYGDRPFAFENRGQNRCACGDDTVECRVLTVGLQAPGAVPPP